MLQVQEIRNAFDDISSRLAKRGKRFDQELNDVVALDDKRKHTQTELDSLLASLNAISKEIGDCFKAGKRDGSRSTKGQNGRNKRTNQTT